MINASRGDFAYTLIDVDQMDDELYHKFEEKCLSIDEMIRVRGIRNAKFNG
jgi:D-3-phosphoglycerate dehydrogenase